MFSEVKDKLKDGINYSGSNLEYEGIANFSLLSENTYGAEFTEEQLEIVKRFEEKLDEFFEECKDAKVEPFQFEISETGLVVPENTVFHRCPAKKDTLKGIGQCGIMASEWFGKLESEGEARLCSFLNQRKARNSLIIDNMNLNASRLSIYGVNDCVLYFDGNNPIMKALIELDFFEYEYLRQNNPEEIEKRYSPGIIELYEKVILPISPSSKNFHNRDRERPTSSWMAIPGGIPSVFVNGICISSKNEELINDVENISKLFPNATIIDETGKVLCSPQSGDHGSGDEFNEKEF